MKRALITGITGQDGSYLAEFLLNQGYEVHGIMRRASQFNTQRIDHVYHNPNLKLHYGDMLDGGSLRHILWKSRPDEVYNLAAQSHVKVSFELSEFTAESVAIGTLRLLEAIKDEAPYTKFYQASSSEMYGAANPPQDEFTPFLPLSPYACAKVFAHNLCANYRQAYGLFICCGILFNHESPRRGETFVTRKITRAATRIKMGLQENVELGNLKAKRDWGYAGDYVRAMWMMLQHDKADDYVVATGEQHSVEEFGKEVFSRLGMDFNEYVDISPRLYRPSEVNSLLGNPAKIKRILGWEPAIDYKMLVQMMIDSDMELAKNERKLID